MSLANRRHYLNARTTFYVSCSVCNTLYYCKWWINFFIAHIQRTICDQKFRSKLQSVWNQNKEQFYHHFAHEIFKIFLVIRGNPVRSIPFRTIPSTALALVAQSFVITLIWPPTFKYLPRSMTVSLMKMGSTYLESAGPSFPYYIALDSTMCTCVQWILGNATQHRICKSKPCCVRLQFAENKQLLSF